MRTHRKDKRLDARSLCSDLVMLEWTDRTGLMRKTSALLEDISPRGACLQIEFPVPIHIQVHIRHGPRWTVTCRITYCVFREIGYFVGIEFEKGARWSKGTFRPRHLLELGKFLPQNMDIR